MPKSIRRSKEFLTLSHKLSDDVFGTFASLLTFTASMANSLKLADEFNDIDSSKSVKYEVFNNLDLDHIFDVLVLANSNYNLEYIDNNDEMFDLKVEIFEKLSNGGLSHLENIIENEPKSRLPLDILIDLLLNQIGKNHKDDESISDLI